MQNIFEYKTPVETYVFINNVWIDDVYRVDWQLERNRMPIYGYNDIVYGQIAEGRQRITGNIFINFTEPGYLTQALAGVGALGPPARSTRDPYERIEALKLQVAKDLQDAYRKYPDGTQERREAIAGVVSFARREGIGDFIIDYLRESFSPDRIKDEVNSLEEPIDSPRIHFDMQIVYGYPEPGTKMRTLKKCSLLGEGQVISAAGSPGGDLSSSAQTILEVYPFVAQRSVVGEWDPSIARKNLIN